MTSIPDHYPSEADVKLMRAQSRPIPNRHVPKLREPMTSLAFVAKALGYPQPRKEGGK